MVFLNFGCVNILVAVMVEHIVSIAAETRESFSKARGMGAEVSTESFGCLGIFRWSLTIPTYKPYN